jgi:hypothetical protein
MRYRKKFIWKEQWFSICSMHFKHDEGCAMCNTGAWTNIFRWKIGKIIFKIAPNVWIWWMNRPNSNARRQIEEWFPKLRKK